MSYGKFMSLSDRKLMRLGDAALVERRGNNSGQESPNNRAGGNRAGGNRAGDNLEPLSASDLEPLPGTIVPQFIRCGKLGCHCQTGDRHGPYFYRVWRDANKVRKVYVKATDVEQVILQCALYQASSDRLRRLAVERDQLWKERLRYSKQLAELAEWGRAWDKKGIGRDGTLPATQ